MTYALFSSCARLGIGAAPREFVGDARFESSFAFPRQIASCGYSSTSAWPVRRCNFYQQKHFRNRLENKTPAIKIVPNIGPIESLRLCHHPLRTAPGNYLPISSMPLWRRSNTLWPDRCGINSIAWSREKRSTCAMLSTVSIRTKCLFLRWILRNMVRGMQGSWRHLNRRFPGF